MNDEIRQHDSDEAAALGAALVAKVAAFFGCEAREAACIRRAYKDTDCGAWLRFTETGLEMGSIVEGSDAEIDTTPLRWTGEEDVAAWLREAITYIEGEADMLWREANEDAVSGRDDQPADAPYRCTGCGRPESDCSAAPCPGVVADRAADMPADAPRRNLDS